MIKLYYDVGELGWTMVLSAHLNFLRERNGNGYMACTYPERECLYSGSNIELIKMPEELRVRYMQLDQDGTHLYNHNTQSRVWHDILTSDFKTLFTPNIKIADPEDYDYSEITKIKPFRYQPSNFAKTIINVRFRDEKIILVFPRKRLGKFGARNLSYEFYVKLCVNLCRAFKDHRVMSFGSRKGAYELNSSVSCTNFTDMVRESDFNKLDMLLALCDSGNVSFVVGSQSAPPKIALVMGIPAFMIGHEKHRHMVLDNWMNTKVNFFEPISFSGGFYQITEDMVNNCLTNIVNFGRGLNG